MYGKYECFVMQMLYVCVLCASCGSSVELRHQPGVECITSVSDESTLTCSNLRMNARYSFLLTGCGLINARRCLYFRFLLK